MTFPLIQITILPHKTRPQFENAALTDHYNMVAIDLYGHGHTGGLADSVDYWVSSNSVLAYPRHNLQNYLNSPQDQSRMIIDVIHGLGLKQTFILGTSQGGFIAARIALIEPTLVSAGPVPESCLVIDLTISLLTDLRIDSMWYISVLGNVSTGIMGY